MTGCDQYNRTQKNVTDCAGGSAYYCCQIVVVVAADKKPPGGDCWWTGCQPDSWAVRGCGAYDRTETDRAECEDGFVYKCCAADDAETETDPDDCSAECRSDSAAAGGDHQLSAANCGKRIVGYYTSWGAKTIEGGMLAKLTHVIYAFLEMRADGTVDVGSPDIVHSTDVDGETKRSRERLEHLMDLAESYPHVQIMFAVGGWENSQYFSVTAESPEARETFVDSVIRLIGKYGTVPFLLFACAPRK